MNKIKSVLVIIFLQFMCVVFVRAQATFDTVTLHFDINKDVLHDTNKVILKKIIDSVIKFDNKILIYGYADYLGTPKPNDTLSQKRANVVKSFLLNNGLPTTSIIQTVGVGQVNKQVQGEIGNLKYRRVDVFIRKNNAKFYPTNNTPFNKANDTVIFKNNITKSINDIGSMKVNETLVLSNILFFESRSKMLPESIPILEELYIALQNNPEVKIKLEGHICCIKNHYDGYDLTTRTYGLSTNRAKLIYDFLINKGIARSRLDYVGFGNTKPLVYPEMSEEDAQMNRRVEVRIIE